MTCPARTILVLTALLLQGCDNNKQHIEDVIKCGYAVQELGNDAAKENYKRNELAAFGGKMPVIDRYQLMRIHEQARQDAGLLSRSERAKLAQLIYEYNATACMAIHRQPPINQQQMNAMMGVETDRQHVSPLPITPLPAGDA